MYIERCPLGARRPRIAVDGKIDGGGRGGGDRQHGRRHNQRHRYYGQTSMSAAQRYHCYNVRGANTAANASKTFDCLRRNVAATAISFAIK